MSIAPLDAKCEIRCTRWPGQSTLRQKVSLSPSRRMRGLPHRGQVVGKVHGSRPAGHDVAGTPDDDRVARPHIFGRHLVLVVERRQADSGSADDDRLELGEGGGLTGPTNRDHDAAQERRALLRRKLVGDRPPRRLGGGAELPALRQIVDLDDRAVYLVVELVAVRGPSRAVSVDLVEPVDQGDVGIDREPRRRDPLERLAVARQRGSADEIAELVGPEPELT
jgi:hypothetical protein